MSLDIQQEAVTVTALEEYATVSIAFVVDRILQVTVADGGLGGLQLTETAVTDPYVKDNDALAGAAPVRWAEQFDTSNWGLIRGRRDGSMVGGAAIAFNTPDVCMLSGRDDIAVLWDIRVSPGERGTGVGSALFQAAAVVRCWPSWRHGALGCLSGWPRLVISGGAASARTTAGAASRRAAAAPSLAAAGTGRAGCGLRRWRAGARWADS